MASVTSYTGRTGLVLGFQEGATSGSYAIGDLVKTDSNGQVVIATGGKILGIARRGYTGTQASTVEVELIDPNEIYVIQYKASATNQNLVGVECDLVYTVGAHTVDSAATTYDEVEIVGLHPGDAVATSGGRLLVRFKPGLNLLAR